MLVVTVSIIIVEQGQGYIPSLYTCQSKQKASVYLADTLQGKRVVPEDNRHKVLELVTQPVIREAFHGFDSYDKEI